MNQRGIGARSAHIDTFCADRLPAPELWPMLTGVDHYPPQMNAANALLAGARSDPQATTSREAPEVAIGNGAPTIDPETHVAFIRGEDRWTYAELDDRVARLAAVLTSPDHHGLVPGNRVLLRGFNSPELAAAILACFHAGLVAVPTMPLLRASELDRVIERGQVGLILCDVRLADELDTLADSTVPIALWGSGGDLDTAVEGATPISAVDTAADDVAMLLFTSGTTGEPKAACQLHRDLVAICDTVGVDVYQLGPDDVVTGTPPLAFAYGYGAFSAFPLRAGATTVLLETPSPGALLDAIETHRATVVFTAPTAYRALLPLLDGRDVSSLRYGASAGETLPAPTYEAWLEATGVPLLDGIGSTEMLHVFLSNRIENHRPGYTGVDVAGYENRVVNEDGSAVEPGEIGHLEVRGPTGCRYLDDERQAVYVRDGWNRTGDLYTQDQDGWYRYQARADDLIVSSGYNVAGPEVETALLSHPAVAECAVIGIPDEQRGQLIKAFVVLNESDTSSDELAAALQDHAKATIAPYKYPRQIEFRTGLPKTGTGKIQRFALRDEVQGDLEAGR